LRRDVQNPLCRFAAIVMMAATMAFTFQGTFIPTSEAETGENIHYHHGFAHRHGAHAATHVATHVHADGTVHRHVIDDGDDDDHLQQPGCPCCWNMAIIVGVLPTQNDCMIILVLGERFALGSPVSLRGTEPNGPRRPPRPPGIA
jgi:hypothetical protein